MKDVYGNGMTKEQIDREAARGGQNEVEGSRMAAEVKRAMERMDKKVEGRPARKMRR